MNLTVKRPLEFGCSSIRYLILIDRQTKGKVFTGCSNTFDIEPGTHTIWVMASRFLTSPRITFDVNDHDDVVFSVNKAPGTGNSTFDKIPPNYEYLDLRQV